MWIYVLQHKHEVFQKFVEWKSFVEKSSGYQVKKLRTDNGGEYTSTEFENFLKMEGIEHQYTIPKTPEQNGVSERMNRTLVETIRSMLAPHKVPRRQDSVRSLVWEETKRQPLACVWVYSLHSRPERREEKARSQSKEMHFPWKWHHEKRISSL